MDTVETFKQWFAENKDNLNIPRLEDLPEDDDWFNDEWEEYDEQRPKNMELPQRQRT